MRPSRSRAVPCWPTGLSSGPGTACSLGPGQPGPACHRAVPCSCRAKKADFVPCRHASACTDNYGEQSVTAWRVRSGGNIYLVVVASTAFLFRYATQMQMQMLHTFTDACMDGYLSPSSVVAPSQPPFSLHKSDIESSVCSWQLPGMYIKAF